MSNFNIQDRLVRFGELVPCKTAFIDAHTPGSNLKENFTIIGAGVSENPDQHVHINIPHGFNIGAAGQPPKCNIHYTAIGQLKYSLFYLVNGDFFGELMAMLVKLFLKKEIYLTFPRVFLEVLKI